jgi:hypothetical protein
MKCRALQKKGDATFDIIKKYKIYFDNIFSGNNHHINNTKHLIILLCNARHSTFRYLDSSFISLMSLFGDYKLLDFKALDNKFSGD